MRCRPCGAPLTEAVKCEYCGTRNPLFFNYGIAKEASDEYTAYRAHALAQAQHEMMEAHRRINASWLSSLGGFFR